MIRTFRSKIQKKTMVLCVMPVAILFVCFFWYKMAIAACFSAVLFVAIIDRLLHTDYVITDDDKLLVRKGRFSKVRSYDLAAIRYAEIVPPSRIAFLRDKNTVLITMFDGKMIFITPYPAVEFCRYVMSRKNKETTE